MILQQNRGGYCQLDIEFQQTLNYIVLKNCAKARTKTVCLPSIIVAW